MYLILQQEHSHAPSRNLNQESTTSRICGHEATPEQIEAKLEDSRCINTAILAASKSGWHIRAA